MPKTARRVLRGLGESMSKLNRTSFIGVVGDLWGAVQQNFERHQRIYSHIVALDSMGRQLMFLEVDPETPGLLDDRPDIVAVPGPWTENLPLIRAKFVEHRAVCAIMVAEAWTVSGDYGFEVLREDMLPSEHPMREEMVFVVGFWPREFVATGHRAAIERERLGPARLVNHEPLTTEETVMVISWLEEMLPQPHGK